eukprot:6180487-Pleurochrysis_carterae.AAC.2
MFDANGTREKVRMCVQPRKREGAAFEFWRQTVRACLGGFRARRRAVKARSPQHAELPNSSEAITYRFQSNKYSTVQIDVPLLGLRSR